MSRERTGWAARLRQAAGYSLIEVMISLVILSVIAALAIPVAQRAVHQSHRGRMLHTLRTISDDQLMYQRDEGTYYPAGTQFGSWIYAFRVYPWDEPFTLPGQGKTLAPGSRKYTYYILRLEPFYPEPLIYAYAHQAFGNDLDGDPFPDMWIKVGSGPPQLYYDDFTDTRRTVSFN